MSQRPPRTTEFSCAGCGRNTRLPGAAAGKLIICPGCGLRFRLLEPLPATLTPQRAAANASPTTRPTASSRSLSSARLGRSFFFPALTLVVSGGALLAITASLSAVILRRAPVPSPPVPSTARPDAPAAPALEVPTTSVPSSPPTAADQAVRVVTLEGRSEAELREVMEPLRVELAAMNSAAADDPAAERKAALVRLRMYRLLCGLSEAELVLEDRLNAEAGAAAKICCRLGYLSHNPPNPGLPSAEFAQAHRGAQSGNLASGMRDLVAAVDGWMDDSDADNLAALGHRRWCLNPPLRRVGFGRSDRYFAMSAHDSSGSGRLPQPAICFPPGGCVPIDMFRPHYAWSVTLDPRAFQSPTAEHVRIRLRKPADSTGLAAAVQLDFLHIDSGGYGIANCIIFRPTLPSTAVGSGYEVTLEGLRDHDGRPTSISFVTQFVDPMTMSHSEAGP